MTPLSLITFALTASLLSLLWVGIAWSLVRVLKLNSPVARVFVYLAPLLTAFFALLRLAPDSRVGIVSVSLGVAAALSLRDLRRYLAYRRQVIESGRRYARAEELCLPLAAALEVPVPRVCLSPDLATGPMVLGVTRPTIVFPSWTGEQLNDDELRVLLAHELAHVYRRDILLKWALLFLRRLAFWNPVAAWPYRWLSLEIEFACDRVACRLTGKPGTLAKTLCKIQQLGEVQAVDEKRLLQVIPRADLGLRARLEYLGTRGSYVFEWPNLFKTLLIFSVYWLVCSKPAEFVLPLLDQAP